MVFIRLVAFSFLFVCLCSIKLCKKVFNPLTVMCGIWSVILFLSSFCLFDLTQASINSYLVLAVGVIFFSIGFFVRYYKRKSIKLILGSKTSCSDITFELRDNIVWALLIFTLIFELAHAGQSISILLSGGSLDNVLSAVRDNAQNVRGTITNVINNLIVGPFKFAIFPICAYNIANKQNKIMTFFILLLLGIGVISSGGRVFIIYLIVGLCVSFTLSPNDEKDLIKKIITSKKQKKRFISLLVIIFLAFIFLSKSRSGSKLLQHMYLYFSMQPIMFETWAKTISDRGLYGYGLGSLNGFTFHILYIIKNVFKIPFPGHWLQVFNSIISVDTNWQPITTYGLPANAYVSAFWYFYLDARLLGIVIGSFIWGWACSSVFKNTIRKRDMKSVCIYTIILFSVVDSYVRIRFATGDFVGGLLLLSFVLFKKKYTYISTD